MVTKWRGLPAALGLAGLALGGCEDERCLSGPEFSLNAGIDLSWGLEQAPPPPEEAIFWGLLISPEVSVRAATCGSEVIAYKRLTPIPGGLEPRPLPFFTRYWREQDLLPVRELQIATVVTPTLVDDPTELWQVGHFYSPKSEVIELSEWECFPDAGFARPYDDAMLSIVITSSVTEPCD